MSCDKYAIVIRADKTPPGQHVRRFNAPTMDDVAIVIVGDEFNSRDIVLRRRNMQLQRVSETHRCYDGLQYPLLFCRGEDDQTNDPELYDVVVQNMIHGPCGAFNINSPCIVDGKCSKRYPRTLDFVVDQLKIMVAVHLENGQRVYFTTENAAQRALSPPHTTLTAFLNCVKLILCQNVIVCRSANIFYVECIKRSSNGASKESC
ncbi:hypothetical protein EVAR_71928_1 [Eumeta japonica]|uniref:Helitron helicase-like domain-containing protein n=1 Tax=Eumeta variegata TaxID=151549 RepID=A0A4C1SCI3_EUMVA|nr:hypothetical protein EVAR_71928_1 [Eumeta japonica]